MRAKVGKRIGTAKYISIFILIFLAMWGKVATFAC